MAAKERQGDNDASSLCPRPRFFPPSRLVALWHRKRMNSPLCFLHCCCSRTGAGVEDEDEDDEAERSFVSSVVGIGMAVIDETHPSENQRANFAANQKRFQLVLTLYVVLEVTPSFPNRR
ncbi:hypothetical protein THAOC_37414 [Thalassiosira oceanica]|uniref:Uncharacterized protein n=1 Tax=Thalassiosira oceanica TaxID=159749 RepID=K0R642_THAOC|nr:hypothetical protein THAOC_37414 [Thalassiosira oceanica]|eukprot:EJK44081.1 hypothetical protein THAOC_37414 [Thalassiosira oceanica]